MAATILFMSACRPRLESEPRMATVSDTYVQSIVIKAPVEKTFSYMNEHPDQWHGSKMSNLQGQGLGRTMDYVYEEPGAGEFNSHGQIIVADYVPNQKVVEFVRGEMRENGKYFDSQAWLWTPVEGGTRVMTAGFYTAEIKESQVKDFKARFSGKGFETDIEKILQKFKTELEK